MSNSIQHSSTCNSMATPFSTAVHSACSNSFKKTTNDCSFIVFLSRCSSVMEKSSRGHKKIHIHFWREGPLAHLISIWVWRATAHFFKMLLFTISMVIFDIFVIYWFYYCCLPCVPVFLEKRVLINILNKYMQWKIVLIGCLTNANRVAIETCQRWNPKQIWRVLLMQNVCIDFKDNFSRVDKIR